jgi:predicted nuclease of predicted toxin-antitoxin system
VLANPFKLLIDEDLSPQIAQDISQRFGIEAVSIRDRNLINAKDHRVFEYAFENDFIIITANVGDFEKFAGTAEVHAGIVFICDGELKRDEQIAIVRQVAIALVREMNAGRDMINRVLYAEIDGSFRFEPMPITLQSQ